MAVERWMRTVHFQKLLCALCEIHGAPMTLGAVWSSERHHWFLESLAEVKSLGPMVKDLRYTPNLHSWFLPVGGTCHLWSQNCHSLESSCLLCTQYCQTQSRLPRPGPGGRCSSALAEY